jgi:hypothetical protein
LDTLLHVVTLARVMHGNDIAATARLLDALGAQLPIEEQLGILEAVFGEEPVEQKRVAAPSPPLVACA